MKKKILSLTKTDFRWDYYRGHCAGGQKRNKTSNCVRCTHEPNNAVGKSEDGRSQHHNNKLKAFHRCVRTKEFKTWLRIELAKRTGLKARAEEEVSRLMKPWNIRLESWNNKVKQWLPLAESEIQL